MSQMRDNVSLLKEMLRKYSDTPLPVINTFYGMISNEEGWESDDIISMLERSKGDYEYINNVINEFIAKENSYNI